jgi:hypothetical protein
MKSIVAVGKKAASMLLFATPLLAACISSKEIRPGVYKLKADSAFYSEGDLDRRASRICKGNYRVLDRGHESVAVTTTSGGITSTNFRDIPTLEVDCGNHPEGSSAALPSQAARACEVGDHACQAERCRQGDKDLCLSAALGYSQSTKPEDRKLAVDLWEGICKVQGGYACSAAREGAEKLGDLRRALRSADRACIESLPECDAARELCAKLGDWRCETKYRGRLVADGQLACTTGLRAHGNCELLGTLFAKGRLGAGNCDLGLDILDRGDLMLLARADAHDTCFHEGEKRVARLDVALRVYQKLCYQSSTLPAQSTPPRGDAVACAGVAHLLQSGEGAAVSPSAAGDALRRACAIDKAWCNQEQVERYLDARAKREPATRPAHPSPASCWQNDTGHSCYRSKEQCTESVDQNRTGGFRVTDCSETMNLFCYRNTYYGFHVCSPVKEECLKWCQQAAAGGNQRDPCVCGARKGWP